MNVFDGWSDIYDKVYAWKSDDIQFYVDQARISGGPILELGCGTGRITIPIAMAGLEIIGLDNSGKMLETAKAKISKIPGIEKNIELIDGDMTTFSIDRQFSLIIIPFNGFLSGNSRSSYSTILRSLERDGGRRLEYFGTTLWFDRRALRYDALERNLDRMRPR